MGRRDLQRTLGGLAALAVTATLTGTIGTGPASSTPDPGCATAAPVAGLAAGQAVHGLTVSSGTTPSPFTGSVIGVLRDGIAPGVDMILARLSSPAIDQAGGIWEGMSGSPVYTADGELVGAVSYGLANGPSPVAGITPAADVEALYGGGSTPVTPVARKVMLPRALARRVVATGAATSAQLAGGYTSIHTPMVVSGLADGPRLRDFAAAMHLSGTVTAGSTATGTDPDYGLVPGGNLVAAISYGEVTAAAVGTVTDVCHGEVVGFGHPFNFAGDTTYTMHGADAVYVQEDSLGAPFKVVNIGAPDGTVTGDHLAGIAGTVGPLPVLRTVDSRVTVGGRHRSAHTDVAVAGAMPDVATATMVSDQDRTLDYVGPGSGRASWTITGTRASGAPFAVTRTDYYTDDNDISYATAQDLSDALYRIASAQHGLTIDSVTTTSVLDKRAGSYRITGVQARVNGAWRTLGSSTVVRVRSGGVRWLRVQLASPVFGARQKLVRLTVPAGRRGAVGVVTVRGAGNGPMGFAGDPYAEEAPQESLGSVLAGLRSAPMRDQVIARLRGTGRWHGASAARGGTGHVVTGGRAFLVRVVR
jgi:hypothetical protein